ncbi:hypothetical protein SDC9_49619 [bioreactor metagenome]|uniref:Uncharacterized protein n=1 Tax=bioreactor metagenome TaxID=1076179 RepID=A0A644WM87_9ZZZZ
MAKVIIRGVGQLNGPVQIDLTLEMDDVQARSFLGSKREEVITATIAAHYPGVKINTNQIGINVLLK